MQIALPRSAIAFDPSRDVMRGDGLREVAPDLAALSLRGDPPRLMQILLNLGGNAVKFTATGQVTVRARVIDETQDTVCLRYEIEDTGIGIAPEDLPRIFEKGYTGCNGRADKRSTGIGLYLCRQIMEKLSHTIRIESEMGAGTKVYLGLDTVSL